MTPVESQCREVRRALSAFGRRAGNVETAAPGRRAAEVERWQASAMELIVAAVNAAALTLEEPCPTR